MEAYDAAVLSYALATAKIKPPFMVSSSKLNDTESLTPPSRQECDVDGKTYLYQALCTIEQQIISKSGIHIQQLLDICSTKQNQSDQMVIGSLESMQQELRYICKSNTSAQILQICFDDENHSLQGSVKNDIISRSLIELLKQFGLNIGSNILKKCI